MEFKNLTGSVNINQTKPRFYLIINSCILSCSCSFPLWALLKDLLSEGYKVSGCFQSCGLWSFFWQWQILGLCLTIKQNYWRYTHVMFRRSLVMAKCQNNFNDKWQLLVWRYTHLFERITIDFFHLTFSQLFKLG